MSRRGKTKRSTHKRLVVPRDCFCETTIRGEHIVAAVEYAYANGEVTIYVWNHIRIAKPLVKYFTDEYVRIQPADIIGFINSPFT